MGDGYLSEGFDNDLAIRVLEDGMLLLGRTQYIHQLIAIFVEYKRW